MDIGHEGIVYEEIEFELTNPTFVCSFSSSTSRLFFLAAVDMLCNIYHHVLLIDIIYNIGWMVHLQFSVGISIPLTSAL